MNGTQQSILKKVDNHSFGCLLDCDKCNTLNLKGWVNFIYNFSDQPLESTIPLIFGIYGFVVTHSLHRPSLPALFGEALLVELA
jgi:hypothetical protein